MAGAPRADLALCAAGLLVAALYWVVAADQPSWTAWCEAAITTGLAALLAIRRTALLPAFAATYLLLGAMAVLALATPATLSASPLLFCAPLSLVAVTDLARSRRWGVIALIVAVAGATVSPLVQDAQSRLWLYSAHVLVLVAAYLWAARRRAARAERAREITARVALARAQERERICGELHDILGHSLTVIHAQANAALSATDGRCDQTLVAIRAVAKSSLRDIRSLVALLRGEPVEAPLDLGADLRQVIAQAAAAGLRVDAHLPADDVLARWQRDLAPPTRLALTRCVQEGMTNALRHAGLGQAAHVEVTAGRSSIEVTITNTTEHPASATAAGGYGLVGLHERVRLLGGTLACGPSPTGFTLRAHLPLAPSELTGRP